jgi:amino acid adenylation domain-containing protein
MHGRIASGQRRTFFSLRSYHAINLRKIVDMFSHNNFIMILQAELIRSLSAHTDRIAIEEGGNKVSYAELRAISDKISGFFIDNECPSETIVAVLTDSRQLNIYAMTGILNAGCVYVPIDPSLPQKRMQAVLHELQPAYLFTSSADNITDILSTYASSQIILLDELLARDAPAKALDYPVFAADDSLYVYFTSGSSGIPKGIIGKNSSLAQFLQWEIRTFNVTAGSRFSQFVSPYFDAFLRDVLVPLLTGGTICIPPPREEISLPEQMVRWIHDAAVQYIHCVPSLFRIIHAAALTPDLFPDLRFCLLSGERINPAELLGWYKVFGDRIQLVNLYGPTEATMIKSYYRILPQDVKAARIPVGTAMDGAELVIMDEQLERCDTLMVGDLYIVSDYLTKGYLNNPELTAQKFLPFRSATGAKTLAYKTGDKARWLPDGNVDLVGREDRQVKIRGIRIETEEIENILLTSPFIKEAVVAKETAGNAEDALIAYITRKNVTYTTQQFCDAAMLHLQEQVPGYMLPSAIVEVSEIPLLRNGKTDYQALQAKAVSREISGPENKLEEAILDIWKALLGDRSISVNDNFHRSGGNSLMIMRLSAKLFKEFGVRISLSELFDNLTIKKQAALVQSLIKDDVFVIPKAALKPAYPASAAQRRVYASCQLDKKVTSYNLPMAWEITGQFDQQRIEHALHALVDRHEALRTAFHINDGELYQYVYEQVDFSLEHITSSSQDLQAVISGFIRPFELNKAPLFRCAIIHHEGSRKLLVIDCHHIICDGISKKILHHDFLNLYNGKQIAKLDIQYKDYAEWEYNFRLTQEYLSHREFWLSAFENGVPRLTLPVITDTIDGVSHRGGNVTIKMDNDVLKPFTDLLEDEKVTPFSGFFTVYFLFLSQLSGQEDIVIGTAASGRMQEETESVVGMFVKMLPILRHIDPYKSLKDTVTELHRYMLQANSRQIYDIGDIVTELNNNRVNPVKSLFDAAFVYQNFEERTDPKQDGEFVIYPFENNSSKYPFTLYVYDSQQSFTFRFEYSSDYFTSSDAALLANQFRALLENVVLKLDEDLVHIMQNAHHPIDLIEDDISFNF